MTSNDEQIPRFSDPLGLFESCGFNPSSTRLGLVSSWRDYDGHDWAYPFGQSPVLTRLGLLWSHYERPNDRIDPGRVKQSFVLKGPIRVAQPFQGPPSLLNDPSRVLSRISPVKPIRWYNHADSSHYYERPIVQSPHKDRTTLPGS